MSIQIWTANGAAIKAEIQAAISSRFHESTSGECTLDFTLPWSRLRGLVRLGDQVRWGDYYFTVTRVSRSTQVASALCTVSCEHISYKLADLELAAGNYSGTAASLLGIILADTGLSVGRVTGLSGTFPLYAQDGGNRREALQQLANVAGAIITYTGTAINLKKKGGSGTAISLAEAENVKSISITEDMSSGTYAASYAVELSRLQTFTVGAAITISYRSLDINVSSTVLSLDYDIFRPMSVSMTVGDPIPKYYERVQTQWEELTESIPEEIDDRLDSLLLHAVRMDFSKWDLGQFTEMLEDGTTVDYAIEFDASDRPIKITSAYNECVMVWE